MSADNKLKTIRIDADELQAWTKEPELARVFEDADSAILVAQKINDMGKHKTEVWGLFETDQQFFTWKLIPSGEAQS